jgi:hypothetical protein
MRKHLTVYVKLKKKIIKTEHSEPDLGLATGDPEARAFDLETPSLSHNFA